MNDAILPKQVDELTISLRAYAISEGKLPKSNGRRPRRPDPKPSQWTLIFDTETTRDAGQTFRFGTYQIRNAEALDEAGIFYEPTVLGPEDTATLRAHATAHGLRLITREAFVDEIFYARAYEHRATIVGFNLPFDISRLAIGHVSARGTMRGGFSFRLSADKRWSHLQVKHLSQRAALIRFAAPFRQRSARSERKRSAYVPIRRGFFVDVHTFAAALLSRSFTLKTLSGAPVLNVPHPKLDMVDHGGPLTDEDVAYAVRDSLTTWECYQELARRYAVLDLPDTPPHQVFSEASIGKGYLKKMGIMPWREVQPDVPPEILAKIMSSYFGGRSEVRIRRELRQVVLCDFLSMYPTVCTLMGLWRFVIAEGMTWRDGTEEVRTFLDAADLAALQRRETWQKLNVLVRVKPDRDIFPVRAQYGDEGQATIGSNCLSSDEPLWFTLADCMAAKLLTGRSPIVVRAIVFEPGTPQPGLQPVAIGGNEKHRVNPTGDDFYKRLIELRDSVKRLRDKSTGIEKIALDIEQNALKIAANATSYGIFVEVNVNEVAEREKVTVHSAVSDPFEVKTVKDEELGRYFHPLLATLITGAARLMLAVAERLVIDSGLGWAFCDTDSIAIARPVELAEPEFQRWSTSRARTVRHLRTYSPEYCPAEFRMLLSEGLIATMSVKGKVSAVSAGK